MKNLIKTVSAFMRKVLSYICAAVMAALTLSVLWGVATRYFFGSQAPYSEELARMLLVCITFLGGAYAFGCRAHIGMDFLSGRFTPSARKATSLAAGFLSLLFVVVVLICGGVLLIRTSIESANALVSMPIFMWQVYLCVPISGVFAAIFIVEQIAETWTVDFGKVER